MKKNRAKLYNYASGAQFAGKSTEAIFTEIAQANSWLSRESISGIGSSLEQTAELIRLLPDVFKKFQIHSLLDIPCGDFNWMQKVDLQGIKYTGADIVASLVAENTQKYANDSVRFVQLNLLNDELGKHDVIFCRDCLVHFSFQDIFWAIANIKKSHSIYLMTTTFTDQASNEDIPTGGWRPLNLEKAPFNFPKPLFLLNEKCSEMDGAFQDKALGVWKINEL